jgi:hypothetical protein
MSSPKLLRILETVALRLSGVRRAAGYYSDIGQLVIMDRIPPSEDDLPCVQVILGTRDSEENSSDGEQARAKTTVDVIAYAKCNSDSEIVAAQLLADIQIAVETADSTLGGMLHRPAGLLWVEDEIFPVETGSNAVGARVSYSAPHIRKYGNPEIA